MPAAFSRALLRDRTGSSTIDFSFALPVLAVVMIATLQAGQVLHAKGSLRHAVGEGVRLAKVKRTATEADVVAAMQAQLPSLNAARLSNLGMTRNTTNGVRTATVTATYTTEANYPIISFPVVITETKTVYLPS